MPTKSWSTEDYLRELKNIPENRAWSLIVHDLRGFVGNILTSLTFIEVIRESGETHEEDDEYITDALRRTNETANLMMNVLDAVFEYSQERAPGDNQTE